MASQNGRSKRPLKTVLYTGGKACTLKALYTGGEALQKSACRKVFTKKSTRSPNRLFLDFFLSRFWAFLGEGSSKTLLKKSGK
jgi:hypothetical protein